MRRLYIAFAVIFVFNGCGQQPQAARQVQSTRIESSPSAILEIKFNDAVPYINGTKLTLPAQPNTLIELLGNTSRVVSKSANTIFVWDDLGVLAYKHPKSDIVHSLHISLGPRDYDFWPKRPFRGTLLLDDALVTPEATLESINRMKKGKPLVKNPFLPFMYMIIYDTVFVSIDKAKNGKTDPNGEIVELSIEAAQSN